MVRKCGWWNMRKPAMLCEHQDTFSSMHYPLCGSAIPLWHACKKRHTHHRTTYHYQQFTPGHHATGSPNTPNRPVGA